MLHHHSYNGNQQGTETDPEWKSAETWEGKGEEKFKLTKRKYYKL